MISMMWGTILETGTGATVEDCRAMHALVLKVRIDEKRKTDRSGCRVGLGEKAAVPACAHVPLIDMDLHRDGCGQYGR